MSTNLPALQSAVNLLADAIKDTANALEPNQSMVQKLSQYQNLIGDIMALAPQIGAIPAEAKSMIASDYLTLVEGLVARLAISNQHAQQVLDAVMKLLSDVVLTVVPDVEAVIAAVKGAPQPVPAA